MNARTAIVICATPLRPIWTRYQAEGSLFIVTISCVLRVQ